MTTSAVVDMPRHQWPRALATVAVFASVGCSGSGSSDAGTGLFAQDGELERSLRREIAADSVLSIESGRVKIVASNGMLALRGVVPSLGAREHLLQVASGADAAGIVDGLEVDPSSTSGEPDVDTNIVDAIGRSLHFGEAILADGDVEVASQEGIVTLRGWVRDAHLRQQVETIAGETPGVVVVVDDLELRN